MMRKKIFVAAIIVPILLFGCNQADTTSAPTLPTESVEEEATRPYPPPTPIRVAPQPYPEPTVDENLPTKTPFSPPTPSTETGVVIGQIIDEATGEPLVYESVYMGDMIAMTPGPEYSIGVQEFSSPHELTDEKGRFAIGDVPPGTYVLMVWTPFQATIVIDPATGSDFLVKVVAGKTIDLGTIETTSPQY